MIPVLEIQGEKLRAMCKNIKALVHVSLSRNGRSLRLDQQSRSQRGMLVPTPDTSFDLYIDLRRGAPLSSI